MNEKTYTKLHKIGMNKIINDPKGDKVSGQLEPKLNVSKSWI
jgi:hypothetical protein